MTASTQKELEGHIPNYPNLPSRLICLLDNVTLHVCMDYGQTQLYKSRTDCRFAPFFWGGVAQINLPCNYSVCLISTQIFAFHSLLVFDWTQGERESKTFYHSAAPGSLSSTYNWTFLSGLTKRHVFCAGYVQADLETDEVYAQMTLIPLHTSVSSCHLLQPITVLSFGLTSVIRL